MTQTFYVVVFVDEPYEHTISRVVDNSITLYASLEVAQDVLESYLMNGLEYCIRTITIGM